MNVVVSIACPACQKHAEQTVRLAGADYAGLSLAVDVTKDILREQGCPHIRQYIRTAA